MNNRISLRVLFGVIAVIGVALAFWQQVRQLQAKRRLESENEQLKEQVAQLQFDLEVARIDSMLKVPTEAIYQDYEARGELDQVRWKMLESRAPEDFVPVYALYNHWPESPAPEYFQSGKRLDEWRNVQDSFWEGYAINHADDGIHRLNGRMKGSEEFRRRLTSDASLRDRYLKPLLMRFVRSTDQRSRVAAVEAMLLLGDRRPELLEVIRREVTRLSLTPARSLNGKSVLNAEYAGKLADRYRALMQEFELDEKTDVQSEP